MTLQSALEDVMGTTLAGVSGIVGKMEYVASLRDAQSGGYLHWGLSRAYGEQAAQEALAQVHRQLFSKILRTPLRALCDDIVLSSQAAQMTAEEYLKKVQSQMPGLLPQDMSGGSARHFNSVLHALSLLLSNPAANLQAATRQV